MFSITFLWGTQIKVFVFLLNEKEVFMPIRKVIMFLDMWFKNIQGKILNFMKDDGLESFLYLLEFSSSGRLSKRLHV